jgi:hypothetical protein
MKLFNVENDFSSTGIFSTLHRERKQFQTLELLNKYMRNNLLLEINTQFRLWSCELWYHLPDTDVSAKHAALISRLRCVDRRTDSVDRQVTTKVEKFKRSQELQKQI